MVSAHAAYILVSTHSPSALATYAGVIGRRMKMEAFIPAIPEITQKLGSSLDDGHKAAIAITTTGEADAGGEGRGKKGGGK